MWLQRPPSGACDCDGNVIDECGVCGGPGAIYECGCDDLQPGACDCDGTWLMSAACAAERFMNVVATTSFQALAIATNVVDECGVCGGPGAIYECGCSDVLPGACDCDGNVVDECGVCGGPGAIYGLTTPSGACDCDGNVIDECGVCGGPGAIYECGCDDLQPGACDCDGNVVDECGVCGGPGAIANAVATTSCQALAIATGTWLMAVFAAVQAIYECGCNDILPGACDCDGNVVEMRRVWRSGAIYECGCNDILPGACDCDRNVIDECGVRRSGAIYDVAMTSFQALAIATGTWLMSAVFAAVRSDL